MIHIATVHWQTDRWIELQQKFLRQHLKSPYRIYAWFNDFAPANLDPFFATCFEPVKEHAVKLNILAHIICSSAVSEDDVLIFLDGDAFPVADLDSFLAAKLPMHQLAAVQRRENNGDTQPHPCFCATTVGFWKKIKGDWKRGYKWQNAEGRWVTDVGGNLLKQLKDQNVNWYPMIRSNLRNPHPVLFGIYDSLIYHHGAGFRYSATRLDEINLKRNAKGMDKAFSVLPWYRRSMRRKMHEKNGRLAEAVFNKIQAGADFVREFM